MADKFQLKALITGVDKLSPKLAGIRKNISSFQKGLEKTGLGKIGFQDLVTGGALAAPFVVGVKAAIDFESQMADVKKVVDFDTPQQFKQMGDDIGRMSERLPMAAGDIAKIVAAGGQSGIARDELLGFAEAAVKMGVAFDQTAEESGDMMAKWRAAFKMTQPEVGALADQVNYLGNTGAKASTVASIVTSVGSLGSVAGLAAGQVAAMAATLDKVGVAQDVAGTGLQNFMLTLTAGSAATKQQQQAFKSLRLDSANLAKGMQKDAQGTILTVLTAISKVDPSKQAAVMTQLFGRESIKPISQLLTSLDILKANFTAVGDSTIYGGSMQKEYASRAATTANNLQLLRNTIEGVARALGEALLPGLNLAIDALAPALSYIGALISANPNLVRGLAIAGVAFTAVRLAVLGATVATKLMGVAFAATPVGIIAIGIAAAAGLIVANWDKVGPFFTALWELIKALAVPFMDFLKSVFAWTPLGMIMENWDPIVAYFGELWAKIKPLLEPILKFMGLNDGGPGITAKVTQMAEEQKVRNAGVGGGTGAFLRSDAAQTAQDLSAPEAARARSLLQAPDQDLSPGRLLRAPEQNLSPGRLLQAPEQDLSPGRLLQAPAQDLSPGRLLQTPGQTLTPGSLIQQTAANTQTKLQGEMVMRFENAPPGLRVEPAKTNQPGLSVTPNVGYRTIGAGGRQ
ncbi:phage tail tape measure protein [Pseudomonas akapageensis]|uniref:phage tail tape measure protein n=1 Tax=Pseudomonas akapageensis TaxID=2609961 RepID=UPI00140C6FE9|nr:phage tail tape measure protein [Pseudomonas akapageensis]